MATQGPITLEGSFLLDLATKKIDLGADQFALALVGTGWTPDATKSGATWADASASEVSGTGYTAGGQALTGVTVAQVASTSKVKLSAADVSWANSTISGAKWGVIVHRATAGTTAGTDRIVAYFDFDTTSGASTISDTNSSFDVNWVGGEVFTIG